MKWSTKFINDLPDASFALILSGGEQDEDGRTVPRNLRKLPYKNAAGAVDAPHLRNALARISQVEGASQTQISQAQKQLKDAAEEHLPDTETAEVKAASQPEVAAAPPAEVVIPEEPVEESAEMDPLVATQDAGVDVAGALEHLRAALTALSGPMQSETAAETMAEFAETATLQLAESEAPENRRAPLRLDVGIIKVGPGNARDNHYYSAAMLAEYGHVFAGVKMYTTDHRDDERSVRTEVALLEEVPGVQEFADGQYLVGRAVVFNPDFAEDVRNRNDAQVLTSLHCSILANGEAKPGQIDEHEYNIVQNITEVRSVDWVTQAGAGGHALQLAETAPEPEEEPVPEVLDESEAHPVVIAETEGEKVNQSLTLAEVVVELGKTNLPAASVAIFAEQEFEDVAAVQEAVTAEVTRLKAAGSGQPLGIQAAPPTTLSLQEIQGEIQAVNKKWLRR